MHHGDGNAGCPSVRVWSSRPRPALRANSLPGRPRILATTAAWRALARVVQCERDRSNGILYLIRTTDMSRVDFEE